DRDKRWDRTKLAYDSMVSGTGVRAAEPVAAIERCYERGETDEFIKPIVMLDGAQPRALIRSGDGVIGVNFRADRMRQIVSALALPGFDEFDVHNRPRIELATMTEYDQTFPFAVGFGTRSISRILAEVISDADLTQLRTAETEKYAHVTYFFNGGYEVPYAGESRKLVPSQRVATYDLKPEMSAQSITDTLCKALERGEHHFYLCNYANGDMVGHTGVLEAAIQATSTVDECITRVLTAAEKVHATVIITADHGNCELMIDPASGGPHTAHTTNLVPLVIVGDDRLTQLRSGGSLRDVAPTVLRYLGVDVPTEMTGVDIREGIN
ncbi:MAG: 2,3-bisphosphoglycerate-independent phosphoglycerate mutase, partial [Gemmatimonadales bacterium]